MSEPTIMQFGTSRFLQAHADLFISDAMDAGQDIGGISVVQSSGDASRAHRLKALSAPEGYPIKIRGLLDGSKIDRQVMVTSVKRCYSTANDWQALSSEFVDHTKFVLSNTGDRGYAPQPADESLQFSQDMSFPAKLTCLLLARYQKNANPIQIMPMELIADNGLVLKRRVLELAHAQESGFLDYLNQDVIWANSLVDRIVSEPLEPAGAVAEPYALWAVENQPKLTLPCTHQNIQLVDRLEDIETLKLFILNLGHTWLADRWLQDPEAVGETVVGAMDNADIKSALLDLYATEVIPAFAASGRRDEAMQYIDTTVERFSNPFLAHRIEDIAQNHQEKIGRRIGAFLEWARTNGDPSDKPQLQSIANK